MSVISACLAAPAGAATTTFAPVADSYVGSDAPATNYGTSAKLRADASPTVRSYLRFDVAGVSGTVTKATLRMFNNTALTAGYSVYGVASTTWGEKTITWSNAPPFAAGATASSGKVAASSTTSLDVTQLVKGNGSVSFGLGTASPTAISWPSREATANRPQLVVETGTTPPPPGGDPVIAAAGDIACDPASASYNGGAGTATACRQRYTSDLLTSGLDRVLTLGDNQYENGELAAFQQSYGPTWGRVKPNTRPAIGNHEYNTSSTAAGYFDYFDGIGAPTGPAGDRGKGYYSYDVGSWHLVALNSNCSRVSCAAGSAQEQWLRADLAAHPATCTLAYWHHPLFSSGAHGNIASSKPLFADLYAAGGDVVLNGHDHDYERFAPQTPDGAADSARGVREFVVGTGGMSQRAFATPKANSQLRNTGTYGVLQLTLHASSYDWKFVSESGKPFGDSGSGSCH
ncbi:MAG: acid phosphatase type 7 [Thermoleophilaceae bacterium]|nr:acid phosphatase type 7 [Thermoleophilaceae bacterium]